MLFLDEYIGLEDKNGVGIRNGDMVIGFESVFIVKYGINNMLRNGNTIQVPCFYFEDQLTKERLFPIKENQYGENDLDELEVVVTEEEKIDYMEQLEEYGYII